ncbi:CusS [Desulforapulum autotrophicum HRM2]|uniref:histidine kinase n=1 Tax=Desulforapulum autotrophicum (strain ATCC 43914 / DSM 3382 / VKM B-1955 / HRM2) TaxID=177437 RepID=C0QIP9_DESAH|nr:PAS domain-containing sensor histidine kinase [Desulforapulum autotrophicum]ACN13689.1 CusS [Desulforapulum autotrophicum HRM2]
MNFERLRMLLIAAFMLVSLVPMAVLGYKMISQGETMIKEKSSVYLKGFAKRNAEAINGFMVERVNDMNVLSNIVCLFGLNVTMLQDHFEQMAEDYSPFIAFSGLDLSGRRVFTSLGSSFDCGSVDALEENSSPGPGTTLGKVTMMSTDQEEIPVLKICTSLNVRSREDCGHLCALVDFRPMGALLRKSNIEVTGEVYLVDEHGRFLSSSRFGAVALRDSISMAAIPGQAPHGIYETTDYREERVLQAYQKVDGFPWYVIADQDMAEILNRINALGREAVGYGLFTALIVFCLAFIISTLIVNILKSKYRYEKELEFQVIQKEKLASLGLLTSGLAHELNTPLANALLYTQIASEELNEAGCETEDIQARLSTVVEEIHQGSKIIRNLLDFSRHSTNDAQVADVNKTLTKLMGIAGPHCVSGKIDVQTVLEEKMPKARVDASTLQSILTNLVANAIEAMPQGGVLKLKTRHVKVLRIIKIEIADSGPGIPKEERAKVFTPFFTTKQRGKGTGLGLFVSHEMVRKLGGNIRVISSTGNESSTPGTVFTVELPTEQAE